MRRGAAAPRAAPASQDQQQRDSATATGDLGAPPGTPVDCAQDIASRPRRNRASPHLRAAISETAPVTASNFVYPLFVYDDALEPGIALNPSIASMPGCNRLTVEGVVRDGLARSVKEELAKQKLLNDTKEKALRGFVEPI